ncbi:MAG: PspC domain-containing protein [Sphingobacteriales bacterium]|jgi:phage shock protein PspC (stress-responsive transcriptional regulator)
MKKVININFQGRVIPIEESAYELLKNYTDSLKSYFANEVGRDEIIQDIENRIAELLNEELKKGSPCITDTHMEVIIKSIGRPEDFDQEESGSTSNHAHASSSSSDSFKRPRASICRNENDKVLGGVCSGLAHYLKLDPTIIRILFALLAFGAFGTGLLIYIILWLVLPAAYLQPNTRKRLYRNPDNKVLGGVASGLAAYFNISVTIPRLLFVFPLIIAAFNSIFGDFIIGSIIFSGFGGTFILAYLILWIVIPQAKTASEKLEMRGEKVDLESIRKGVKNELNDLKGRAKDMSDEFSTKVKDWEQEVKAMGKDVSEAGTNMMNTVTPVTKSLGVRIVELIGSLFKIFFLFFAILVVFALFSALMVIVFTGGGPLYDLKPYIISETRGNLLFYASIVLLIVVPTVGFMVWIIRRITNRRAGSRYLGWTFGGLWTIGFVCATFLAAQISRNFRKTSSIEQDVTIVNPSNNKLLIDLKQADGKFYNLTGFDEEDEMEFPRITENGDSLLLNTIRVVVLKSMDSQYHVYTSKQSRAETIKEAESNASKISFPITQQDSVLLLPAGFVIDKATQFRNQRVVVYVEVPLGKQIKISDHVDHFDWFTVKASNNRRNRGFVIDRSTDDHEGYDLSTGAWFIMTDRGPELTDRPIEPVEEKMDSTSKKDTIVNININTSKKGSESEADRGRGTFLAPMISVSDLIRW